MAPIHRGTLIVWQLVKIDRKSSNHFECVHQNAVAASASVGRQKCTSGTWKFNYNALLTEIHPNLLLNWIKHLLNTRLVCIVYAIANHKRLALWNFRAYFQVMFNYLGVLLLNSNIFPSRAYFFCSNTCAHACVWSRISLFTLFLWLLRPLPISNTSTLPICAFLTIATNKFTSDSNWLIAMAKYC